MACVGKVVESALTVDFLAGFPPAPDNVLGIQVGILPVGQNAPLKFIPILVVRV